LFAPEDLDDSGIPKAKVKPIDKKRLRFKPEIFNSYDTFELIFLDEEYQSKDSSQKVGTKYMQREND
jgi:hypothetical protein